MTSDHLLDEGGVMTQPAPDAEARLGSATDEEWLEGHTRLTELVKGTDFPEEQLSFIWDPDLDPSTLIDPDEVDHAPGGTDA